MNSLEPPFDCPWCEDPVTDEDAYDHAYQHQDKAPYAVYVEDMIREHNAGGSP